MRRSTWIVLAVIIFLGVIYLFTREDKVSVGIKHLKIPTYDENAIDEIAILGKKNIKLKKIEGTWNVNIGEDEEKFKPVDTLKIESFFQAADTIKPSHYVTNLKEKYDDLGISIEKAKTVQMLDDGKVVWSIVVGKEANVPNGRYVRLADNSEVFVARIAAWQLIKDNPSDFRDRSIVQAKPREIQELKIREGNKFFEFAKKEGEWSLKNSMPKPSKSFQADSGKIKQYVSLLANLRASSFVDEEIELKEPNFVVMAKIGAKERELYKIYQKGKDIFVKSQNQIYKISQYNFKNLKKDLNHFRDLTFMKFNKDDVTSLTIQGDEGQVKIEKDSEEWKIVQPKELPDDFEFDADSVEHALTMLSSLKASRLATAKDHPSKANWKKQFLLKLSMKDGSMVHMYATKIKDNEADEYLVSGNVNSENYVIKESKVMRIRDSLSGNEPKEQAMPGMGQGMQGLDSLPPDIRKKLMDAARQQQ